MIPNPLVVAAQRQQQTQQQIQNLLRAGAHLAAQHGMPKMGPFVSGVPTQPQTAPPSVTPQQHAPTPPPQPPQLQMQPKFQGDPLHPSTMTPDQLYSQAQQYDNLATGLFTAPDAPQPTYQAPVRQQQDPRAILLEGLGALFLHDGSGSAIAQGMAARDKDLETQYQTDVDQAENAYNRQMASYDRTVAAKESQGQHYLQAAQTLRGDAETMRDHQAREAAVNQGLKIKAEQVANQKSEAADRLKAQLFEAAQKIGVAKSNIAEHYWAVGTQQAGALQRLGMRDDTAINVAQLGATARLVSTVINGQNSYSREQLIQSGAWDRMQAIQQNTSARAAMNNLSKLLIAATNPKNPGARAAAAQIQAQMDDPNSPISQLQSTLQQSGIMGEPVGDEIRAEVEASTAYAPQAGGQPITIVNAPQQPAGYLPEPGGGTPMGPASMGTVQEYMAALGMGHPGAAPAPAAAAKPGKGAAAAKPANVTPQDLENARGWLQSFLQGKPMSPQSAAAAWQQFVSDPRTGAHTMDPHELAAIHAQLLGSGGPQSKNSPIPSQP